MSLRTTARSTSPATSAFSPSPSLSAVARSSSARGVCVGDRPYEGGEEFLAVTAHRTSGDGEGSDGQRKTTPRRLRVPMQASSMQDHQKHSSFGLAHSLSPFVGSGVVVTTPTDPRARSCRCSRCTGLKILRTSEFFDAGVQQANSLPGMSISVPESTHPWTFGYTPRTLVHWWRSASAIYSYQRTSLADAQRQGQSTHKCFKERHFGREGDQQGTTLQRWVLPGWC